jgi:hypothetical protein
MEKEAMDKLFNYMKAYSYPHGNYPMRSPYYQSPQDYPKEDKERKTQADPYSQMYGYPPYNPYQMHPMGYSQHYAAEHEQEAKPEEDKGKLDAHNPYAHYYPYNHYYPYPYAYPPYYYGQRETYGSKSAVPPAQNLPGMQPISAPADFPQLKILSKAQEKAVKEEIVISSDSENAAEAPPPSSAIAPEPTPASALVVPEPIRDEKPQAV